MAYVSVAVLVLVILVLLADRHLAEQRHADERRRLVNIAFADRPAEVAMLDRAQRDQVIPERDDEGPRLPEGL